MTTCLVCRGACCEALTLTIRENVNQMDYYDLMRTRAVTLLPRGRMMFSSRCPELTPEGLCGIHEDKPKACREFPCGGTECLEVIAMLRPQLLEG